MLGNGKPSRHLPFKLTIIEWPLRMATRAMFRREIQGHIGSSNAS